ncbi:hypothetical protein D3C87_1159500 [compost metagenome]
MMDLIKWVVQMWRGGYQLGICLEPGISIKKISLIKTMVFYLVQDYVEPMV